MTTTTTTTTLTRAARAAELEALHVRGPAAEAVLRLEARARHRARVEATMEAAREAVRSVRPEWDAVTVDAGAGLLIAADLGGVGGHGGWSGAATRRHPYARSLGSGRWHASDGSAYRAAGEAALTRLLPRGAGSVKIESDGVYLTPSDYEARRGSPGPGDCLDRDDVIAVLGPDHAWAWSVSRIVAAVSGGRGDVALGEGALGALSEIAERADGLRRASTTTPTQEA